VSSRTERCAHGREPGNCECYRERVITSISDAEEIYESGKATWDEWSTCGNYFLKFGQHEKAVECIVRATTMLRDPRTNKKNFVGLVGQYLEARASQAGAKPTESQFWLLKLANQIKRDLRERLRFRKQAFEELLSPEIAQMMLLAASSDNYSQLRLAAKLRRQREYETQIRWGRPQVAKEILDALNLMNPRDTYVLVCRSATHRDLGNITDSILDAQAALKLEPSNLAARTALASAYLAGGLGLDAVREILKVCEEPNRPNIALVCMVYAACACVDEHHRDSVRKIADDLMSQIDPKWDVNKTRSVVEIAALKMLCANDSFLHALQLLAELDREGWSGNTEFWKKEIYRLARKKPGYPDLPDFNYLKANPQDFFPDHKAEPTS
jgi:hypothetical protein